MSKWRQSPRSALSPECVPAPPGGEVARSEPSAARCPGLGSASSHLGAGRPRAHTLFHYFVPLNFSFSLYKMRRSPSPQGCYEHYVRSQRKRALFLPNTVQTLLASSCLRMPGYQSTNLPVKTEALPLRPTPVNLATLKAALPRPRPPAP